MLPVQRGLLVEDKIVGDVEAKVVAICGECPSAANSDAELLALYWLEFDGLSRIVDAERFRQWMRTNATPAESITRARRACRRLLNTSPAVERRRQKMADNHRKFWRLNRNE